MAQGTTRLGDGRQKLDALNEEAFKGRVKKANRASKRDTRKV